VLTGFLILTFTSALAIGYRPVMPRAALWLAIAGLLGADMALAAVMGRTSACGRPTGSSTAH